MISDKIKRTLGNGCQRIPNVDGFKFVIWYECVLSADRFYLCNTL